MISYHLGELIKGLFGAAIGGLILWGFFYIIFKGMQKGNKIIRGNKPSPLHDDDTIKDIIFWLFIILAPIFILWVSD